MKLISLVERRLELSAPAFLEYYENQHVPLAKRHFPFEKYVRNYVVENAENCVDFDCVAECWIDVARLHAILAGPMGAVFTRDQHQFMQGPARSAGVVASRTLSGRLHRAPHKHMLLLRTTAEAGVAWNDCLRWARALAVRPGVLARITLDRLQPEATVDFGADIVVSVWCDSADAIGCAESPVGSTVIARCEALAYS